MASHLFWTLRVYLSVCFFFKGFHQWHISEPVAFRPEFRAKDTQETRGVGVKDSSKKMAQFDFSGSIELITRFKAIGNPTYIAQNSHVWNEIHVPSGPSFLVSMWNFGGVLWRFLGFPVAVIYWCSDQDPKYNWMGGEKPVSPEQCIDSTEWRRHDTMELTKRS